MNPAINPKKIIIVFLFSTIVLFLFQSLPNSLASPSNFSLEIDTEFEITEFSTSYGFFAGNNTLDLDLPSSSWNIDEIELNFTDVEFGLEVKVIEDNPTGSFSIDKFHDGYGVQISIQDPTIIYGVQIYGNNESTENKPIYIQINGQDNYSYSPNNTIYGTPHLLNMSYSILPAWHIQTFSTPVYLTKGTYYLVMDGTSIGTSPKSIYHWYFNNVNPTFPEINISENIAGLWGVGIQGTPLLYKLIQKVNDTFFPEDINMTAELNGNSFEISNGNNPGKGYLKKSNLNYHPNRKNITVEIKNNKTENLEFNLNYKLNINSDFLAPSKLKINSDSINEWLITPEIERFSINDSIKFEYPNSWSNISVIKNQQDISSDIIIDSLNNIVFIPNHTIESGAEWEINANSPSINFDLSIIETEWRGGQELRFSIADPILEGTYKFLLKDEKGIEIFEQSINLPTDTNRFTYNVPPNILEGDYIAYVSWYNQTDAGVQIQIFSLSPKTSPVQAQDLSAIFITMGIVLIGGVVIGGSSYVTIKKVQTNRKDKLKFIMDKCSEIMDIEYIIVLHKKSGIDVYSEALGEKKVDPTLISGFLQAIQNFGSEVLGRAKESRTFKVEYQKSILLMTEFVNLRLIIIMKESPSKNFLYTMESLAYDIYHNYGNLFNEFQGNLEEFQGIKNLLEEHLGISFLYPLTINSSLKMKLSQLERDMIKKAYDLMRKNNLNHFYSIYLLPDNVCTPKDFEAIKQLIKKKIFNPVEISPD
jgi:hypothetical protein